MNSGIKTVLIFAGFLFVSVLLGACFAYGYQFFTCKAAAESLGKVPAIKPARFLVYGSSPGTVSCHFSLYDRNAREIASIERSWNGGALYVDFATVKFDDTVLQFPIRHYSDLSKKGVLLKRYYLMHDICAIYSICLLFLTIQGTVAAEEVFEWIRIDDISFKFGFLLDNISALFLTIFTVISFFIQLYSYEYIPLTLVETVAVTSIL